MKQIILASLGIILVASAADASTVRIDDWTNPDHFAANAGPGGAFKATIINGAGTPFANNTSFLTFCLEYGETINLGNTFDFGLSPNAIAGGMCPGPVPCPPAGDPVSDATKWLYYNARTGGYAGIITGLGGNVNQSGSYVQQAIWLLEHERTSAQINNQFPGSIAGALAAHATANAGAWAGLYAAGHRVEAMNLTKINNGELKQDQLAYWVVAVPDGDPSTLLGMTAVMSFGVIGYLVVVSQQRRRRRTI